MTAVPAPSVTAPLYQIAQARSGDKGDTADITVFLPTRELFDLTDQQLAPERIAAFLAPLVHGKVERYTIPNLFAYKFVCHEALGGGGSSSLRNDNLGKSMAAALLRMEVSIPEPMYMASPLRLGPGQGAY